MQRVSLKADARGCVHVRVKLNAQELALQLLAATSS